MDNDDHDTRDIDKAIRRVFCLDRGVTLLLDDDRVEAWARTTWQRWADAGHVPNDLDAGPDHADLIALLGALALLHQDFIDEEDEFGHDLTGAWPLASTQQLAHYCGRHDVNVESELPDFAMDDAVAHHALPLALHLMGLTGSREQAFAELLALTITADDPLAEANDTMMHPPTFELMHRYERFTQLWERGEHVGCPACAHSVAHPVASSTTALHPAS